MTPPPPVLVVTIDTEEEGRWSSAYPRCGQTCDNVRRLPRLQRLFERLGVVPTWLVDYPVVADERSAPIVAEMVAGGRGEIGAHLHPWCNPPFGPHDGEAAASYAHNLPPDLQEAKLRVLVERMEAAFGARPTSYRAGRWGFDHGSAAVLEKLGFTVDTSVVPLWFDPSAGGPVFLGAPLSPYRLHRDDVCRPGASGVVEVPVTSAVCGRLGTPIERLARRIGPVRGLRGALARLGQVALRPEMHTLAEMRALVDETVARGVPVLNLMFHSSAVLPGATPYVRDLGGLERFCARLDAILEYARARHAARPLALARVAGLQDIPPEHRLAGAT